MAESLVAAIEAGDYALTKQLLQRGADANGRLHSWVTMVQAVLDVEELRNTGTSDLELNLPTPLLCAIEHRRQDLVGLLLEYRADPNQRGEFYSEGSLCDGRTSPLECAAKKEVPEIRELLLAAGARS